MPPNLPIGSQQEALELAWWLLHWDAYGTFYSSPEHRYTSAPTAQDDYTLQKSRLQAYMTAKGFRLRKNRS